MGRVLVACEYSGIVRDAFMAAGHDAISCDLLPTERPGPHIQGDVREALQRPWDLVIAHPPCNRLSRFNDFYRNAEKIPDFHRQMIDAACFFNDCYCANAPMVAIENPEPMTIAKKLIGSPDNKVQPYMFGDPYRKKTCWWLRGLPPLMATCFVPDAPSWVTLRDHGLWRHDPGANSHIRAQFWPGMAAAMARQWGCFLPE